MTQVGAVSGKSPSLTSIVQNTVQTVGRYSTRILPVAAKLLLVALPLFVLANIPGAEAGPLAYASCMAGCIAMGPFAPACWPACLPILALPTP